MQNVKNRFNNLSLYKKIMLIISVMFIFAYLFYFFSIHVLTDRYEKELYQANAQSLNHVTSAIVSELQVIETISADLLSDTVIQENLTLLLENPAGSKSPIYRRNIYEALYPYTFHDNFIKSIHIILPEGTDICMGNTADIEVFDRSLMDQKAKDASGRLMWVPSRKASDSIAGTRQIRQMKYLDLRDLATLSIVVDMEQLIQSALRNAGYTPDHSNFILLHEGKRIYPEAPYQDELCIRLSESMASTGSSYTISTIEREKKFIITGTIPYGGWNYLYFRDYDKIFHEIQSTKVRVRILSAAFALIALFTALAVVRRILTHLDYLVEKIRCFGSGQSSRTDGTGYNYTNRKDEIGQLHVSFDEMTRSVKVLRDENYEKQILLRDATIRMLRQQINPHFLYNTLDTINWMAQKLGADDISTMVRSLGNLFRASVTGQEDLIPLSDELSVLDNYIRIQKIRFKDRLNFELVMPEDLSLILVPKLCIQPLVENALKHAMEYTDDICTIQVSLQEQEEDYTITVANTGSRFEEDLLQKIKNHEITPEGSGVGLVNIDSRMRLIYGDSCGLSFYNRDGMAVVVLTVPKERKI